MSFNRIANSKNHYQGGYKKVLCVCSAGLLRSPTAAMVLSKAPYNFNTRAAGLSEEYALISVDEVLLYWCDEVVCMEPNQAEELRKRTIKPVICLDIQDSFRYRDPKLIKKIKEKYNKLTKDYTKKEDKNGKN